MKYLPDQLTRANEDYLTIPAIRKFAKANNIKNISDLDRPALLQELEKFAETSESNIVKLQDWFENVLAEGIKNIYMLKSQNLKEVYNSNNTLGAYKKLLNNGENVYINNFYANKTFMLYRVDDYLSDIGSVVRFSCVKKVSYLKNVNEALETISIPIQIVLLLDHDLILIQFKSKSNIYEYVNRREDLQDKITDEKLVNESKRYLEDSLKINFNKNNNINTKTLYNLLTKFTSTPKIIQDKIEGLKENIENITRNICHDLCNVSESNIQDIKWDITNIVEKYISINVVDKSIFTKDRVAYPIKLISSDEEDSRVEQCAPNYEPLQTKSIFYDNKKMMQKNKRCDGIYLMYHTLEETYFNKEIEVRIQAKPKYMVVKFTKYTTREDMENVFRSIISSEDRTQNDR